VQLVRKAAAS